jgi:hypothetical protein
MLHKRQFCEINRYRLSDEDTTLSPSSTSEINFPLESIRSKPKSADLLSHFI